MPGKLKHLKRYIVILNNQKGMEKNDITSASCSKFNPTCYPKPYKPERDTGEFEKEKQQKRERELGINNCLLHFFESNKCSYWCFF